MKSLGIKVPLVYGEIGPDDRPNGRTGGNGHHPAAGSVRKTSFLIS
jgi:hypothetical protein